VRYDGAAKQSIRDWWPAGESIEWIGVCPEVELGMGVPREPVQLEGEAVAPRMLGVESRVDHTCAMHRWAKDRLAELGVDDLDGFVLKSRSPSCGLLDSNLVRGEEILGFVDGLFTASLRAAFPFLPLASESQLEDSRARAPFLTRAHLYRSYKELIATGASSHELKSHYEAALRAYRSWRTRPVPPHVDFTQGPLKVLRPRRTADGQSLLRSLNEACERAVRLEGAEKAKELTRYGQLLHDLLDPSRT
jgi:uncharacterized protein YbbK (DUF523 family)